ncbi:hypothetical protein Hanom_Chr05g00427591 [Helianthus anomalus]
MPEPSQAEPDSENKFRVQNIKFPKIPREQKDPKPFAPMEIIVSS